MKIILVSVGKEKDDIFGDSIKHFEIRILRYFPIEWLYIPHEATKEKESEKGHEAFKSLHSESDHWEKKAI